jgi:hypothetical protein
VFEKIKAVRPHSLYVAADGPRQNNAIDVENCENVRRIFDNIDWPCEIKTFFRTDNKGCKLNVSGAITWFFQNVEEGIILEDDCIVEKDFFKFCEENLAKYRDNPKVMHISASNFQSEKYDNSYYFSIYNHIWGWASWRRAWNLYSLEQGHEERSLLKNKLKSIFDKQRDREYWLAIYDYLSSGNLDTWDYSWMFSMWKNDGISITPNVNLVKNIGFGQNSTHTADPNYKYANMDILKIDWPLKHPSSIRVNQDADQFTSDVFFNIKHSAKTLHLKIRIASLLSTKFKHRLKKYLFK